MAADAGGSGRGLCCAFLLSFLPEVKTTNRFDLYAFPPLNRVFSMRLWLLQAPPSSCQSAGCHGNTPPSLHCCLLSPAASGCRNPGGPRVPFEVLFSRLRFGNNGNIPILRRRAAFLYFLESRGAFGTDPVCFFFTELWLHFLCFLSLSVKLLTCYKQGPAAGNHGNSALVSLFAYRFDQISLS